MLQLINVRKSYATAAFKQVALDSVSVAFRDNEFVAILGPSGSGKTTLLNIIGGLDRYDSGSLTIDGVSTEKYRDRDWDAYRNNRIGFVFQSYNLIAHQTVLANVELALTLSGVSKAERRKRAVEALKNVGLEDHIRKKPGQLSGGQMQRVAIARALINNPEILLADEPTGALDSQTGAQIMALLTKIAKDRLVIMVTHNPALAEEHATRIIDLSDGGIRADSNPFVLGAEAERADKKPVRNTVMSFFTALSLSFNNLMTKKGRTFMTAFAGSIGIIGIAAILALANGVNNYIKSVEENTLSVYPLTISSTGIDFTSMLIASDGRGTERTEKEAAAGTIRERKILTNIFKRLDSNDLASLKTFLDDENSGIEPYINSVSYSYSVTPQIFSSATGDGVRQINPDTTFSALGFGGGNGMGGLASMGLSTDIFHQMPDDTKLLDEQYNLLAGRWPENYNECVLVLTGSDGVSDLVLYAMGLRDPLELREIVRALANDEDIYPPEDTLSFSYDEIMDISFKLVNAADFYKYEVSLNIWSDMSADRDYMKDLVNSGVDIHISGIVRPNPSAAATALSAGLCYPASLTRHLMDEAAKADIVRSQLADPLSDVFSGRTFEEETAESNVPSLDMSSLISIDQAAVAEAFKVDFSGVSLDFSDTIDLSSVVSDISAPPAIELMDELPMLEFSFSGENAVTLISDVLSGYFSDIFASEAISPAAIVSGFEAYLTSEMIRSKLNSAMTADDVSAVTGELFSDYIRTLLSEQLNSAASANGFSDYINSPEIRQKMAEALAGMVDTAALEKQLTETMQRYMTSAEDTYIAVITKNLQAQVERGADAALQELTENMAGVMNIDPEAIQNAFSFNVTEKELSQLMTSFLGKEDSSVDSNLKKLGYADPAKPSGVAIYPVDFNGKEKVIEILDGYNAKMKNEGHDARVITYTDIVGTLMTSVTDIISKITAVLLAFVAISLVVSSIMIGVITYISVLERKKEIGILRSIGASKRDIGNVFNAETIIVGFVAGVLGVGVTSLVSIPVNALVYKYFDVVNIAVLPPGSAAILVAVSMALTLIAGLIPSSAASRKDPVEALRSE